VKDLSYLIDFDYSSEIGSFVDDETYHADRDHISSSSLRKILRSPNAWYMDYTGEMTTEKTPAMEFGTAFHDVVLNGKEFIEIPRFSGLTKDGKESSRSKEAIEAKKAFLAQVPEGVIAVSADDADRLYSMIGALKRRPEVDALLSNGNAETSMVFSDPSTGLKMKIKPDYLSGDYKTLVDLKTTKRADRVSMGRTIFDLRYDFQLYMYARGIEIVTGVMPERIIVIAVENEAPYEVGIYQFQPHDLFIAQSDFKKATETLVSCIKANEFPMAQQVIETVYVPQWWVNMKNEEQI